MEFLFIWLLFGLAAMVIANAKERSGCGWFLLGLLLGPFGLIVAFLPSLKVDPNVPDHKTHGRYPHCAEFVLKQATICKHCGGEKVGDNWNPYFS